MKQSVFICLVLILSVSGCRRGSDDSGEESSGWVALFNGRDLTGWKASEAKECFSVKDGAIVVQGGRSHLFYTGGVEKADFKDFEFMAKVKTTAGSNSGIYFHSEYQETGWPNKGHESQVNISHSDTQKSGGLYGVVKVNPAPAQDNQWYTHNIIVKGKHIIVKIDGKTVVDYTEPEDVNFPGQPGLRLSSGTFALQAHDPKSLIYFKDIKVRVLK